MELPSTWSQSPPPEVELLEELEELLLEDELLEDEELLLEDELLEELLVELLEDELLEDELLDELELDELELELELDEDPFPQSLTIPPPPHWDSQVVAPIQL